MTINLNLFPGPDSLSSLEIKEQSSHVLQSKSKVYCKKQNRLVWRQGTLKLRIGCSWWSGFILKVAWVVPPMGDIVCSHSGIWPWIEYPAVSMSMAQCSGWIRTHGHSFPHPAASFSQVIFPPQDPLPFLALCRDPCLYIFPSETAFRNRLLWFVLGVLLKLYARIDWGFWSWLNLGLWCWD